MTKEELERIKRAYNSGLKIQIWFNGHWEDFDIREYSMYSEPFSEHRRYRIVGSSYADIAEQKIAELEKVCQDLSDKFDYQVGQVVKLEKENAKAKEIIKGILPYTTFTFDEETDYYLKKYYKEAEDFIKE